MHKNFFNILFLTTNILIILIFASCSNDNISDTKNTSIPKIPDILVAILADNNSTPKLVFSANKNIESIRYCTLSSAENNECIINTQKQALIYNLNINANKKFFITEALNFSTQNPNFVLIEAKSETETANIYRKIKIVYNSVGTSSVSDNTIYDYTKDIQWTTVPNYGPQGINISNYGPHYEDVLSHTYEGGLNPRRNGFVGGGIPSVDVHEIAHMLHAQISQKAGLSFQGVYYEKGKAVVFRKPKTKITDFNYLIPDGLKKYNYTTYTLYMINQPKQQSLNNIAYLFDEWAAYSINVRVSLELESLGKPEKNSYGSNNAPLFFGFIATGLHFMLSNEPEKLNDKQFKAVFALFAEYTWEYALRKALNSSKFKSGAEFFINYYTNNSEFQPIKESLIQIYGAEWVHKLIHQ